MSGFCLAKIWEPLTNIRETATILRRLPDGSGEQVGSYDVQPMYVGAFPNHAMALQLAKAMFDLFHRKRVDYFGVPSLKSQCHH